MNRDFVPVCNYCSCCFFRLWEDAEMAWDVQNFVSWSCRWVQRKRQWDALNIKKPWKKHEIYWQCWHIIDNSVRLHPAALLSWHCKIKASSILRSSFMPSAMQAQDFLGAFDGSHTLTDVVQCRKVPVSMSSLWLRCNGRGRGLDTAATVWRDFGWTDQSVGIGLWPRPPCAVFFLSLSSWKVRMDVTLMTGLLSERFDC